VPDELPHLAASRLVSSHIFIALWHCFTLKPCNSTPFRCTAVRGGKIVQQCTRISCHFYQISCYDGLSFSQIYTGAPITLHFPLSELFIDCEGIMKRDVWNASTIISLLFRFFFADGALSLLRVDSKMLLVVFGKEMMILTWRMLR
jgi:hypothetical protein